MATYEVTSPDGKKFDVTAPDGASQDEVLAYAKQQFNKQAAPTVEPPKDSAPVRLAKNIPGSAAKFAGGIWDAVTNPGDTLKGLVLAGEGAARAALPKSAVGFVERNFSGNPEIGAKADETAGALWDFYKNRYGSLDKAKESLIEDPVGVVADASTVLGVGGALVPGKVGQALNTASKVTNPLSVIPATAKAAGVVGKHGLGLTTGVGAENIAQAAKAGFQGKTDFWKSMSGQSDMADVVTQAKAGLDKMRQDKSAQYRSNMSAVKSDKTVLSFDGIDKAIGDASAVVTFKGQVKNERAAAAVQQMADDVEKWKGLPPDEFHTPEGLDALKQKLGATLESIPFEERTARLAAGKVYDSVKSEITKQAPVYAKTMEEYTKASEQLSEIERAFSLGNRAAQDTAMRKLQSLTRNNVNTNYGNRLDLAKKLKDQGGQDIFPAIAGQAMNTWTSRGLAGQAGSLATLGTAAAMSNPALVGLLPFQSPKAVGATLYGTGRAAGAARNLPGLDKLNAETLRLLSLIAAQSGQERPQQDW